MQHTEGHSALTLQMSMMITNLNGLPATLNFCLCVLQDNQSLPLLIATLTSFLALTLSEQLRRHHIQFPRRRVSQETTIERDCSLVRQSRKQFPSNNDAFHNPTNIKPTSCAGTVPLRDNLSQSHNNPGQIC